MISLLLLRMGQRLLKLDASSEMNNPLHVGMMCKGCQLPTFSVDKIGTSLPIILTVIHKVTVLYN